MTSDSTGSRQLMNHVACACLSLQLLRVRQCRASAGHLQAYYSFHITVFVAAPDSVSSMLAAGLVQ